MLIHLLRQTVCLPPRILTPRASLENTMEPGDLARYRKLLEDLRAELQTSLAASDDETNPVSPDRAIGRLTRQDAMLSQQMALEIKRRNEGRLSQIRLALERLDAGDYGYCTRCEEEISAARLNVRPEAPTCISCAGGGR
ncbi:MAG: TraR/DksA C4-type zinc finger protein [Acidobacteria bacterium]|nr:TraR/DksA C4-type zinc finger protein [Acidobacteriota bacterium]MDA1235474.1 TraR/DksA C4-type zinc finger protein [Acidobacteriota bacterium]